MRLVLAVLSARVHSQCRPCPAQVLPTPAVTVSQRGSL